VLLRGRFIARQAKTDNGARARRRSSTTARGDSETDIPEHERLEQLHNAAIQAPAAVPNMWIIKGPSLGTVLQVSHYA
jgi:hypothetical protein